MSPIPCAHRRVGERRVAPRLPGLAVLRGCPDSGCPDSGHLNATFCHCRRVPDTRIASGHGGSSTYPLSDPSIAIRLQRSSKISQLTITLWLPFGTSLNYPRHSGGVRSRGSPGSLPSRGGRTTPPFLLDQHVSAHVGIQIPADRHVNFVGIQIP